MHSPKDIRTIPNVTVVREMKNAEFNDVSHCYVFTIGTMYVVHDSIRVLYAVYSFQCA